ncbi:GNAT family N-acetyltransferase [Paenibacillus sp. FSL W8-1187]|uniref:Ribosomal protein N-acetyltransferase n=1 Tax=Paenibacillus pasadenensis TaxID=217090 RepID=A0A2N5N611_9BACL|nr:GNAT family N-acetyltransferase [Paenibacillus pasadenensis]PLT45778.1 ribosomal protein N-acetyltransferase [Paenibacillus pasadenensis]
MEPMLLDIDEPFESGRLLIRAPRSGDGAAINEAVKESLERLKVWMPWAQQAPTSEESELDARRADIAYRQREDMRLLLLDRASGRLIGCSGLHRIDWKARCFELGYWVRTGEEGKGYVTEAVHAITAFAAGRLGAHRIEIRCDARNERSAAVARRCGFTLEGVLRGNDLSPDGSRRDTMVFAKVRGAELDG